MPFTKIEPGSSIETLNKSELDEALSNQANIFLHEAAIGVKYLQITLLSGTPNGSGVLNVDGSSSFATQSGPRGGFIWTSTRMSVSGLATGATPDIVNLYRGTPNIGVPVWQFNGNSFGYTFGKLQMALNPGQYYSLYGTSLAATGLIALTADIIEVPAEMIYKLV